MNWEKIETIEGEVHQRFLREAYCYARQNSHDPTTRTGAVVVSPDLTGILACGANHFPNGMKPTAEQINDKAWKAGHIIHAEVASIQSTADAGRRTQGTIMYSPWSPCTPCAEAIVGAGIKRLVVHKDIMIKTPERWRASIDTAFELLEKSGVERVMYDGKIGGVSNLFNGSEWYP